MKGRRKKGGNSPDNARLTNKSTLWRKHEGRGQVLREILF